MGYKPDFQILRTQTNRLIYSGNARPGVAAADVDRLQVHVAKLAAIPWPRLPPPTPRPTRPQTFGHFMRALSGLYNFQVGF